MHAMIDVAMENIPKTTNTKLLCLLSPFSIFNVRRSLLFHIQYNRDLYIE